MSKFEHDEAKIAFGVKVLRAINEAAANPLPRPTLERPWSEEKEAEMSVSFGRDWLDVRELLVGGLVIDPESVSLEEVFSVGESFGSSRQEVEKLAHYIERGCVSYRFELGPTIDITHLEDTIFGLFSGKTLEHKQLCFYGAVWLRSIGKQFSLNLHYSGGIADVFSEDRSIAIECGYTQARKALDAVRDDTTLAVIPYTTTDIIFLFSPGPNVQQLIDEMSPSFKNNSSIDMFRTLSKKT